MAIPSLGAALRIGIAAVYSNANLAGQTGVIRIGTAAALRGA
jgi:hypothetical protein